MREIYLKGSDNQIVFGDCQDVMTNWLVDHTNNIDLVYLDPPDSHGHSYKLIQKIGVNQGKTSHSKPVPKNLSKSDYFSFIRNVIKKSHELLNDKGNIFIHCPPKTSHHIRIMLDDIFGSSNFANEIIYKHNHVANSQKHFSYSHDTILFYHKSSSSYFNPEPTAHTRGKDRRNHMKKNTTKDGRVYYSINRSGKEYRYYEDDLIHKDDIWDDIDDNPETYRYSWEGQKPLDLVKRIIASGCPKGGIVCDPFCGSGITGVACTELERNFLISDNSHFAVNISKSSIAQSGVPFYVDWGNAITVSHNSKIKFSYKDLKIHLDDYRADGGDKYYLNNLLPTEDTLVEFWSVGQMKYNKYHVDDFDLRTNKKPALGRHLNLSKLNGDPYAFIYDVFGNISMHKLDIK